MTESVCCVPTCWLMSTDPSVGISVRMHFHRSHGCIYIWIQVHSNAYVLIYVSGCSSHAHRDHVKDCVSYRCKPRTSGWHISNAQRGSRGGAKPQWRAVPQSLKSLGLRGGD